MIDLKDIIICRSELTNTLYLARQSRKYPNRLLDKRECEPELLAAIKSQMMCGYPGGSVKRFKVGESWYEMTLRPYEPRKRAKKDGINKKRVSKGESE